MRLIPLLLALSLSAQADPVLLASRRGGWVEVISLQTLQSISRIRVPAMTESVASDTAGEQLFIAAPERPGEGCCALYALNPQSGKLSFLVFPALSATVTAGRLFTQRGSVGIEVLDPRNLFRLPTIQAPSIYSLRPSPDERLLAGTSYGPAPALDLFDIASGALVARRPMPGATSLAGAWLGQQYYLFAVQSGHASLRPIAPDRAERPQTLPESFPTCRPSPFDMIAAGNRLAIYRKFGGKGDDLCPGPGGFLLADPATGVVSGPYAALRHFRQMTASPNAAYLYGLDVSAPAIVKIDAAGGQVTAVRALEPDVWYMTAGAWKN